MKMLAKLMAMLSLAYWLLLAHVSLTFLDKNAPISEVSKDGQYKVFLKDMYPINPIGLYCLLTTESPIYFALYDANGNYIGQSSPFTCYGKWNNVPFRFPGEEFTTDENSFVVFDDEYDGELNISTKQKRWWSILLAPFS
ncbi:DUF6201 family protein [Aeromonas bestiarum]|uniref:DUF6201 family protein n=1 Tax=Aeromonas bestiarum TaxID=105751 RepID=UPI0032B13285